MNAPRMTGVWKITFQNAAQSMSRMRLRHQSGPPPCSAPKTSVPASFADAAFGPPILADPVAAIVSAARASAVNSQNVCLCIDPPSSQVGCDERDFVRIRVLAAQRQLSKKANAHRGVRIRPDGI